MTEKILARSKQYNTNEFMKSMSLISVCFMIVAVLLYDTYYEDAVYIFFCIGLVLLLVAALITWWLHSFNLTVTDKRIYGNTAFGKQVDLPVDSISAISTSILKGITVATSSGRIVFKLIKNRDDIRKIINELIIDRQEKNKNTTMVNQKESNADEIKKYKDLLDSGIITQEDFEAKKKQLLNL